MTTALVFGLEKQQHLSKLYRIATMLKYQGFYSNQNLKKLYAAEKISMEKLDMIGCAVF